MAWKGAWISYHVPSLKQAHTDVNMLLRLDEIVGRSINVLPLSEKLCQPIGNNLYHSCYHSIRINKDIDEQLDGDRIVYDSFSHTNRDLIDSKQSCKIRWD